MMPRLSAITAAVLVATLPAVTLPQQQPAPQTRASAARAPSSNDQRRANKLYLDASKFYVAGQFDDALRNFQMAAQIDPGNIDYRAAADVARSHLVTSLIQTATKARLTSNEAGARAALTRALALDPQNPIVTQHLYELQDAPAQVFAPLQPATYEPAEAEALRTNPGKQSFHIRSDQRAAINQVFHAYGVTALVTDTVTPAQIRFDLDDADFDTAMRVLSIATKTFYVPLDTHQALVARDTPQNRAQYMREGVETVYLYGLSATELTDAMNLARNVFGVDQAAVNLESNSLTLRGTATSLDDFNTNMQSLLDGRDQVMLDVRIVQVAHTSTRNTGVQPPQSISAFNVYAEEQSIFNANQSLVQQIISSGLASANDPLAILGILLASGQVSSSLFSGGVALFGGGLTQSALSPSGPATFNFNLNTSDSRALDSLQLRLGDGEAGSIKEGSRYPIQTSSYSSLSGSIPNIPGLTGAGSSSALGSLLSSLSGSTASIPMIQYQDLGLSLKVTPKVMRGGDVALTADLTLDALSGSTLNGNPILTHQAFSGVVTLKEGESAELASQINESQSRAISGTPGLSDVPGLSDTMNRNVEKNFATLLIIMTPHLVRATQDAGHNQQMRIERGLTQ